MEYIFLSFLGLGPYNPKTGKYRYKPTVYRLNSQLSQQTEFVQVAEMEILKASSFNKVIIVTTQKAHDTHYDNLIGQLAAMGADKDNIIPLIIKEDMTAQGQWQWFEQIMNMIGVNDALTVDLTHGYRSIPIVFSTAINFLQKAYNISLKAVFYGAFERDKDETPIIDMKEFYIINEWAESVSRLVEDADARKMAQVAQKSSSFQVAELNDEAIIRSFEDLTETIRNVDVNNVATKADHAIRLIKDKEKEASVTGRILLKLVLNKFASLACDEPLSMHYDKPYFNLQLEIIELLLEHKLFMQAYTVMREFIGSIGMICFNTIKVNNAKGRKKRGYAELFINMLQYDEVKWNFRGRENQIEKLMPFYQKLKVIGVETILRKFGKNLVDYRNGFDHAWTSKKEAYTNIEHFGSECFKDLEQIILILEKNKILNGYEHEAVTK